MEIRGFSENNISEQNKETLQSETWQETRKVMKTDIQHFTDAPEIQHFATEKVRKNDNVYGVVWGNVVREYLKTAYTEENAQAEVVLDGATYKVLRRENVTAFYDADGNTLFDVENTRLEKEYEYVMLEDKETRETQEEKPEEESGNDVPADDIVSPDPAAIKQMAKEKLEKELKGAKNKNFAEPIIGYLLKRCKEDEGVAEDVVQEHKTWKKCFDYIYEQARKQATGNRSAVRDDVVYEWAEDYYHKDDKAEEEKKAKKEAEAKAKAKREKDAAKSKPAKTAAKSSTGGNKAKDPIKEEKTKEQPKKNGKDMEGQLDMFSMMGM